MRSCRLASVFKFPLQLSVNMVSLQTLFAVILALGVAAGALYFAYDAGYLDPLIEQFG